MKTIPKTENPLVLRTDFSNPIAWERIQGIIRKPVGFFRFRAHVEFLDDPAYQDLDVSELLALLPKNYPHSIIFIVDRTAVSSPDFPVLVMDLSDQVGRLFRAIPSQVQGIENNLSISNMDFDEFASAVDEQGVFRGFPRT